jgi:hypothetical protein
MADLFQKDVRTISEHKGGRHGDLFRGSSGLPAGSSHTPKVRVESA